jgi:hypothetical protein
MTKREKRIATLLTNPAGVRFEDACQIASDLGFQRLGGKGSHCTYGREGEPVLLNFQNRNGYVKPYQARQLIELVRKYGHSA